MDDDAYLTIEDGNSSLGLVRLLSGRQPKRVQYAVSYTANCFPWSRCHCVNRVPLLMIKLKVNNLEHDTKRKALAISSDWTEREPGPEPQNGNEDGTGFALLALVASTQTFRLTQVANRIFH